MKVYPKDHQKIPTRELVKVIIASCAGSIFEWYDFELFALVASNIAKHFFSALPPSSAFIMALFTFASGLALRPIGALIFGHFGDKIGRKYTFLVTITATGLSTFLVGCLPTYDTIGIAAPILLIILRCVQGLAVGGEYGGAATYIAEYAPQPRREASNSNLTYHKNRLYTGFIQASAIGGDFTCIVVVIICQLILGKERFEAWGWRVPFLLSSILLAVSIYIRTKLNETPLFLEMKEQGKRSKAPLRESFTKWKNLRLVVLALFGAVAGQAAVGYAGTLYGFFFITQTLKVEVLTANLCLAFVTLLTILLNILFGYLSDKIGRKPMIMLGCLLAGITIYPIFLGFTHFLNPDLEHAMKTSPAVVIADPSDCSVQLVPAELKSHVKLTSSCDLLRNILNEYSVTYSTRRAPKGSLAKVVIGNRTVESVDVKNMSENQGDQAQKNFTQEVIDAVVSAGYPVKADPKKINIFMMLLLWSILCSFLAMTYASLAAWLVELFPTRIRYTSLSLPYHIGNGWVGGFLPTIAFSLVLVTGNIYAGLWYPIIFASIAFVVGTLFLPETKDVDISSNDENNTKKWPIVELYEFLKKR